MQSIKNIIKNTIFIHTYIFMSQNSKELNALIFLRADSAKNWETKKCTLDSYRLWIEQFDFVEVEVDDDGASKQAKAHSIYLF